MPSNDTRNVFKQGSFNEISVNRSKSSSMACYRDALGFRLCNGSIRANPEVGLRYGASGEAG